MCPVLVEGEDVLGTEGHVPCMDGWTKDQGLVKWVREGWQNRAMEPLPSPTA